MRSIRKGFTLIEVLVVLVVLGILSGIAIAKFVNTKEAAYLSSMKADLRNLAIYEQNYLIESQGSYFAGNGAAEGFVPTPGVTISATIDAGPPPSWHAVATHDKTKRAPLPRRACPPGISTVPEIVRSRDSGCGSFLR
jgi:prepilin-type N-terminal cleavage/methylation domain-containing protein